MLTLVDPADEPPLIAAIEQFYHPGCAISCRMLEFWRRMMKGKQ